MSVSIDAHEVRELQRDLTRAHSAIGPHVVGVIEKAALNIKKQLQAEARKSRHFRQIGSAISYDIKVRGASSGAEVEAEIGPEKGSPGSLANIAYFGTSRGGGTVPDPRGALDAEAPNVERFLGELLERFTL